MNDIKKWLFPIGVVIFSATFLQAGSPPQTGTIVSENSVNCGTKGAGHKQNIDLLCQEYVVHAASTDYHVRQAKPGNKALLPVNTKVEFTIDKDKMKFKVDGKSYEYIVVSEAAANQP